MFEQQENKMEKCARKSNVWKIQKDRPGCLKDTENQTIPTPNVLKFRKQNMDDIEKNKKLIKVRKHKMEMNNF